MSSLGFAFNESVRSLICEACEYAIPPLEVKAHCNNQHRDSHMIVDDAELSQVCRRLKVANKPPVYGNGPYTEVEGVKVQKGIVCPYCGKALVKPSSMAKHHGTAHPDIRPAPKEWPDAWVQRFNHGAGSAFFSVNPLRSVVPTEADAIIKQLRSEMQDAKEGRQVSTDARTISPWLLSTKWHEHVKGYDVGELYDLVAFPKQDIPGLKDAVLHLMRGGVGIIGQFSELFLQHLNTPDPAKT